MVVNVQQCSLLRVYDIPA